MQGLQPAVRKAGTVACRKIWMEERESDMGNIVQNRKRDQKRWYGKISLILACVFLVNMMTGCSLDKVSEEKLRNLEYTVLCEKELPQELVELIEKKKENSFKMTFENEGYLYICQGYGMQPTAGYSIRVDDAYVTSNAIYFSTSLIGPSQGEAKTTTPTCPYIVIKTEQQDLTVVFE